MFPKPKSMLVPNTYEYESGPMVKATGFREYDARWLFEKEINLMGVQALGMGLGSFAGGWLYDQLGSYAWLFITSAAVGVLAGLLALCFRGPRAIPAAATAR